MRQLHIETPVLESSIWRADGRPVLFKLDAVQPSGSFKLRGIGLLCMEAVENGARAIVCASGGNAGYAAAYAGRQLGVPVVIVVPESTGPEARAAIMRMGARLEVHGENFDAADLHARALAASLDAAYVHPFDHPTLWRGHATLVDEVVAAGYEFDCVVTSVGGGGLLLGILEGLRRNQLGHVPVIAVETEGAASLHTSLARGSLTTLAEISSIATSLGARTVAEAAFNAVSTQNVTSVVVSDRDALDACIRFADTHRLLVEPACGAALAALTIHEQEFAGFSRPLVEICGGIGVSLARIEDWCREIGTK